jgi:signal transduction histidine kinase/ABC-type nitrate/sulfonate/bicarbonate transport system substrate-binding protein
MKKSLFCFIFVFFATYTFAEELKKVSLQLHWKHQFEFAGFYMAQEKGYYKNVGLDVEIKEFQFSTNIVDDIQNGKSDFGVGYPSIILDKSLGKDIVLIGTVLQSSPHILISLKSSGIKSIKDFKGKKIMINKDGAKTASFTSMLHANDISFKDMEIVDHSFNNKDLINKKVDIMAAFSSNELYKLDKLGVEYNVWDPKDYGFDLYDDIGFTSGKFLKENRKLVLNYKEASKKGWLYAFNNIEETIDLILKKYNTQNKTRDALRYEAKVLKELAFYENREFGKLDKNKIQRILDIYTLLGLTKNKIDINSFIFNKYSTTLTPFEKQYLKDNKIIRMCNNPNWKPIEFKDDGIVQGISVDTMKLLEKKLAITIKHIPTKSWGESQQFLKEKKCDILPAAIKTAKRQKYARFTKPYLKYKLAIVTTKDKSFIQSVDELVESKKTIARKKSSGLIHKLREKYEDVKIIETKDYLESLQMVSQGKAYCTIATLPIVSYYMKEFALNNLQISGYTDMVYNLRIAVRDDKVELLNILDKALRSITEQEQEQIYDRWTNIKIEEKFDYIYVIYITLAIFLIMGFVLFKQFILARQNRLLKEMVDERTKELQVLNDNLAHRVQDEVEKNRQSELRLLEQSKMAAMGEMIGNIAHQWRQPLSIISTAATGAMIQKELGVLSDQDLKKNLKLIDENSQYLSKIIDTFRDYLKEKKQYQEVIVQERLKKALNIIQSSLDNNYIELIHNLDEIEPIKIKLVVGELSEVIINIINNAKDVIKEREIEKGWIKIYLEANEAKIIITIEDNAGGISEDILPKIFDPYFTTKHKSQGTGLGLHMSYKIVTESLHGKLYVQNTQYGAKFFVELPR